jgi:hypothetical protein
MRRGVGDELLLTLVVTLYDYNVLYAFHFWGTWWGLVNLLIPCAAFYDAINWQLMYER